MTKRDLFSPGSETAEARESKRIERYCLNPTLDPVQHGKRYRLHVTRTNRIGIRRPAEDRHRPSRFGRQLAGNLAQHLCVADTRMLCPLGVREMERPRPVPEKVGFARAVPPEVEVPAAAAIGLRAANLGADERFPQRAGEPTSSGRAAANR